MTTPAAPMPMDSTTLAAMLGSVQPTQPHTTPLPATTFAQPPMALNPQISQMIMQLMAQQNNPGQLPTLGQLLGGGGGM